MVISISAIYTVFRVFRDFLIVICAISVIILLYWFFNIFPFFHHIFVSITFTWLFTVILHDFVPVFSTTFPRLFPVFSPCFGAVVVTRMHCRDEWIPITCESRLAKKGTHTNGPYINRRRSNAFGASAGAGGQLGSAGYSLGSPPERGAVGLRNLGNTCFMSTYLPTYAHTPNTQQFPRKFTGKFPGILFPLSTYDYLPTAAVLQDSNSHQFFSRYRQLISTFFSIFFEVNIYFF